MNQAPRNVNQAGERAASPLPVVEQVLRMSEAMLHAVQLSDWREVERLSAERHPLLMSIGPHQPPAALAAIRRIQSITDAVAREAQAARDEIAVEFRAVQKRTAGARAYLSGARLGA